MASLEPALDEHHQIVVKLKSQHQLEDKQGLEKVKVNVSGNIGNEDPDERQQVEPKIESHVSFEDDDPILDQNTVFVVGL
jgi:hypothetical protein